MTKPKGRFSTTIFSPASRYTDCVCVPDLNHLVKLPAGYPMGEEAVVVLGGARLALGMVKQLRSSLANNRRRK